VLSKNYKPSLPWKRFGDLVDNYVATYVNRARSTYSYHFVQSRTIVIATVTLALL